MSKKALPPFNPDSRCPKCGGEDVATSYDADQYECSISATRPKVNIEHLHRRCRRCDFDWCEGVLK
jgi:hypothetical protein